MVHWRNCHGQVDMPLAPRMFLLGPNASGKSNVLDALRFLRDTADQGLQAAIGSRGGMGAIRCLHARRPPGFTLAVTVGNKTQPAQWKYSLQVRNHPQKHVPEVVAESVTDAQGHQVLCRPTPEDEADPDRLRQTHLEQVVANQKFRPLTEFLTSIRYLHVVPQLMRDLERSAGRRNDPFGADLLETIAATPQRSLTALVSRLPSLMTRLYRRSPRQLLITTHSPHLLNDPGIGLDEVHLLKPGPQGTEMIPAMDHQPTASLYSEDGQLSLGEILMPAVDPEQVDRFPMAE